MYVVSFPKPISVCVFLKAQSTSSLLTLFHLLIKKKMHFYNFNGERWGKSQFIFFDFIRRYFI